MVARKRLRRNMKQISDDALNAMDEAWHAPTMDLDDRYDLMQKKVARAIKGGN